MRSREKRRLFVEEAYAALAPRVVEPGIYNWLSKIIVGGDRFMGFIKVIQRQPYTAIHVEMIDPVVAVGVGFSKVSYPDKFDERYGRELALRKALAEIARSL